ncbi:Methionine--tRNA ligase [Buchnera aphidicola (Symydobius americanus)]
MNILKKKILVTCALPYANGSIHIGHLLEHIQADIWVRYKKMIGHEVWFCCADDSHGTAIMIESKKSCISPESLISCVSKEHQSDFKKFNISHDHYSSTNSRINKNFVKNIYLTLKKNKFIIENNVEQLYDLKEGMFLPDRFIRGICPVCYQKDQYGDNCESCGSIYKAVELINPISNLSLTKPVLRNTVHLFFSLSALEDKLKKWVFSGVIEQKVLNKLKEWFQFGLKDWDISRDSPYFGFKIPDFLDKYFYVWFDALISYISSFQELCQKEQLNFYEFWKENSNVELYHFIGKDIIYFHALFWPAILEAINFRKPTKIFVHGYLTYQGIKLSKSRGSIISAKKWIKYLDSDSLRYYYASKLSSNMDDIEMNLEEFTKKINSDIVNKIVNLAARNASFLNNFFENHLSSQLDDINLYQFFVNSTHAIGRYWEDRKFNLAIRKIIELSDLANEYINNKKPWNISDITINSDLHNICSTGINFFRIIIICIKPVMPDLIKRSEKFLITKLNWESIKFPLLNHKISIFKPLYKRIDFNFLKDHF